MTNTLTESLQKNTAAARAQVGQLQEKIVKIADELHWLSNAPLPLDDALANIDNFVKQDSSIMAGLNHFYNQELGGLKPFEMRVGQSNATDLKTVELGSLICSLFNETIKKTLIKQATELSETIIPGPPLSERKQITIELQAKKRLLEIQEEQLICDAEELRLPGFYRRENVDPEIVLLTEA